MQSISRSLVEGGRATCVYYTLVRIETLEDYHSILNDIQSKPENLSGILRILEPILHKNNLRSFFLFI